MTRNTATIHCRSLDFWQRSPTLKGGKRKTSQPNVLLLNLFALPRGLPLLFFQRVTTRLDSRLVSRVSLSRFQPVLRRTKPHTYAQWTSCRLPIQTYSPNPNTKFLSFRFLFCFVFFTFFYVDNDVRIVKYSYGTKTSLSTGNTPPF